MLNEFSHTIHTQQTSSNPKEPRPFDPSPDRSKSRQQIENSGCIKQETKQLSEQQQVQKNKEYQIQIKRLAKTKVFQKTVEMCQCKSQNSLQNSQDEEILLNQSFQQIQSYQKEPKKSQIQQYLEKMLKSMNEQNQKQINIKKDNVFKPLSIFNEEINKSKSKLHFRSNSQLSLTNYQSQFVPYYDQIRTSTNSSYYNNKKECVKLIDLMKNKKKVIKIKK